MPIDIWSGVKSHAPEILIGIGILNFGGAIVLAIHGTTKAEKILAAKKEAENKDELTKKETFEAVWKCYIPTAAAFAGSVACIVLSDKIHLDRAAALTTAYNIAEVGYREYRDKTREIVGEEKEKEIHAEATKRARTGYDAEVTVKDPNATLIMEPISGRMVRASRETILRQVDTLNDLMRSDMMVSLLDLGYEIGIPSMEEVGVAKNLFWESDKGKIEIDFDSFVATSGEPGLVIRYLTPPTYKEYA